MGDGSVREIPDAELIRRAMISLKAKRATRTQPMWAAVGDRFCLGSTYSRQLCERFGINPDEKVRA